MTPQQKAEYEQDMRSFRDEFINELARELATAIDCEPTVTTDYQQCFRAVLSQKLPGALEVMYPVLTIEDQSRR